MGVEYRVHQTGLAAELWTLSALAGYTREHAPAAGHGNLAKAGKATIWRILHAGAIKPHKVEYYLERRDAQFDVAHREGRNRYRLYGQTAAGRYLFVVLERVESTVYKPITARDMTQGEKRNYRRLRK